MAGGLEGAVGSSPRNKRARISRSGAVRLLGEIEVDRRWPQWGEHRAAVVSVPGARTHYGEFPWCGFLPGAGTRAAEVHTRVVQHLGTAALRAALAG